MPYAQSTGFPDVLDARFAKIFHDRYTQLKDEIDTFFTKVGPGDTPQKQDYRTSSIGTFGDISEFTGTINYQEVAQGYDGTITPKEYAGGFQVERKLFDDDLTGIMDGKAKGLATAYQRTRQKHAAQWANNAFSVDGTWNSYTEAVALCSNSHTTTSGASTSSGFDNLNTGALNSVTLAAARIAMVNFRGDQAERIQVMPSMILIPPDLYQIAHETIESAGVPEDASNASNVHHGKYRIVEWNYLTDTNNWFLIDETMMKDAMFWFERTPYEFAMVEDFDTLVGKWRLYGRYGHGHADWRWILGSSVS
jgi:phage major head subunit gpT-like protein